MRIFTLSKTGKLLVPVLLIFIIAGCSLEKKNGFNRTMQNLTAHYNILFNANEILRLKQDAYATSFVDSYNELLNVYPDTIAQTATPDKDLEDAVAKANKIINIKEQSHYLGDAYLVMGKARFLEGNYFDAVEYCNYVIRSFGKEGDLDEEALVWKARALLYLKQMPQAKLVIDSAIQNINPKKGITGDVYATKLQYDINVQNYPEAEEMAKQAIEHANSGTKKLRWIFILAQLQELNLKPGDAYANYTRIIKSNSSFEMAFNASLNRIRIQDNQDGVKTSKIDLLRALLKEQNNKEFVDQIYYQIAEQYYKSGDIANALKNYKLSARYSLKNQNQKGLSYLRIADIEFKNKADYNTSKLYYDSTLLSLSPNYPGYQLIQKKSNNLQILTGLLQTIAQEDTLQMLAKLDTQSRKLRIDTMVARKVKIEKAAEAAAVAANASAVDPFNNSAPGGALADNDVAQASPGVSRTGASTFYFYNTSAVGQGVNDFQRQWGNRKLEDDWRRSKRSNQGLPANTGLLAQNKDTNVPGSGAVKDINSESGDEFRQDLVKNLPLTPELMAQSNSRLYNAYMDLGNFYRDILEDKKEAIAIYELLLTRFPESQDKPAVYYNLYRLYAEIDPVKSTDYKNRILKEFPQSVFAKVILDPDYSKKLSDVDAEFNGYYNQVYDLYTKREYAQVIARTNELLTRYPDNRFAAQLYYLRALAAGHQEKVAPFITDLQQINARYPNDQLIVPLVNQHLAYIDANKAEMLSRPVVLSNVDTTEVEFTPPVVYQKQTEYRKGYTPSAVVPQVKEREQVADLNSVKTNSQVTVSAPGIKAPTTLQAGILNPGNKNAKIPTPVKYAFSNRDSSNYYFVVNVTSGTTNLASSRFGIGQFNRTHYEGKAINHQLAAVGDDDQVIYVGRFYSLKDVKDYARGIIPLLPDIMKVPKDKYSFFIITKENLDKLADQKTLDSYIDYYQKNY